MQMCFVVILAMQYIFKPFASQQVQHMQVLSSVCLVFTSALGLSIFDVGVVAVPQAYKEAAGVLGLLANLAFMCWCAWMTIMLGKDVLSDWVESARTWFQMKLPQ